MKFKGSERYKNIIKPPKLSNENRSNSTLDNRISNFSIKSYNVKRDGHYFSIFWLVTFTTKTVQILFLKIFLKHIDIKTIQKFDKNAHNLTIEMVFLILIIIFSRQKFCIISNFDTFRKLQKIKCSAKPLNPFCPPSFPCFPHSVTKIKSGPEKKKKKYELHSN